jgi:hypothetical protein
MPITELEITRLSGFGRGKTDAFSESPVVLGTDPTCSVIFDGKWDKTVSAKHATIEWREDSWWIVDHSREGVWIRGQKLSAPRRLDPSTEIELGRGGPKLALRYATQAATLPPPSLPVNQERSPDHGESSVPIPQVPVPSLPEDPKQGYRRFANIAGASILIIALVGVAIVAWRSFTSTPENTDFADLYPPDPEFLALLAEAESYFNEPLSTDGAFLPAEIGKSWAVVVGINEYSHGINSLAMCVNDANAVANMLRNTGTFAPERVFLMTDESPPDLQPTSINIERVLRTIAAQARPEDLVYFSFSGHGDWDAEREDSYLLTSDANPQNMERTTLYGNTLRELFAEIPAEKLIAVIDACHAGGIQLEGRRSGSSRSIPDAFFEKFTTSKGQVTIRSSAYNEYSYESPTVGHGIFTYHWVDALGGTADADGDGIVTLTEARTHVARTVTADAMKLFGEKQTPSFTSGGLLGEVGDIPLTVIPQQRKRRLGTIERLRQRSAELAAQDKISAQEFEQIKSKLSALASRRLYTPSEQEQLKLALRLLLGKTDPKDYRQAAKNLQP